MKVLVTGAAGQLGRCLARALAAHELVGLGHAALDVTRFDAVRDAVAFHRPTLVINASAFNDVDGVTLPPGGSGFGRSGLRYQNKIFAMLVRGRLVLKLPAERVDALVDAGEGDQFDANKGTPMREWFSLDPESGLPWLPLATEALEFAQAGGKSR